MIEFKNASKAYNEESYAVRNLELEIKKGEFVTLIGPSGCGKTTSLKMINRLIDPTEGTIRINGKDIKDYDIHELRWNIGYVLQQIALFPHMTVEQNITVVPELKKWNPSKMKKRSLELMEMIGLESNYLKRYPSELSGGQQQRIGVIRALAADPDIILMDEPFSALDPISRKQLQEDVSNLQQEIKKTIVFVTHDIQEAVTLGDRVCLLKDGQIEQLDTPENLIQNPVNAFVREFIGNVRSPWERKVGYLADYTVAKAFIYEQKVSSDIIGKLNFAITVDEHNNYQNVIAQGEAVKVEPISAESSLDEAVNRMSSMKIPYYPVVNEGKLAGVISNEMIIRYLQQNGRAGEHLS